MTDEALAEPAAAMVVDASSSSTGHRIARVAVWLGSIALVLVLLEALGVDLQSWLRSLFDELTSVDREYVVLGLGFQTLETLLSGIA